VEPDDDGKESWLLKFIQRWAISPKDAKDLVGKYRKQVEDKFPGEHREQHQARIAEKIVARYARLSAMSGGTTALVGVVPGLGTALAALGGGAADTAVCMKLQVDMVCCLTEAYGYDLHNEDARHLSFLLAVGGVLEHAGEKVGAKIASEAGVRLLRQYLKGAALQAIKAFFKRVGIIFTRKALEKAAPFGIGVLLGSSANYALSRYVAWQATEWFVIDRKKPEHGAGGA
jgi:uncharacterized protein (DUF697 family)